MDDREEESGMDTTYVGIILVVFLVVAALAIDIGYLYVSEDDLHNAAEVSALAGAEAIKQRIQVQLRTEAKKLDDILNDPVQSAARTAAIDAVSGQHKAAALVAVANNDTNRLTTENDVTVGFWNVSTHSYTPGGTPVNAIQVRTRRTAESESVGLGAVGSFIAKISGPQKFNYTPEAIAAFPPRADANFAVCAEACGECAYPNICAIPERKMTSGDAAEDGPAASRFAFTSLSYPPAETMKLSDLICMEMPPQDVCGKRIFTIRDAGDNTLRDLESVMYNPNAGRGNKEYDKSGKLVGWWVIAPVTVCSSARQEEVSGQRGVVRYALIRISRICVEGASGCQQSGTSFKAPPGTCGGEQGLYIDRISCIDCGSKDMSRFPGLHPVIVGESGARIQNPE